MVVILVGKLEDCGKMKITKEKLQCNLVGMIFGIPVGLILFWVIKLAERTGERYLMIFCWAISSAIIERAALDGFRRFHKSNDKN